ncbi:uncharacterized protein LOC119300346 [Triticum dicoccoides]|uniref:uncharacterized protein LOC119300346 n=1 Tax=Triticum dicoccoides TaxID=85692 RepID=UPI00188EB517|nr:uncharacterized protein LOC119300346 [Triticum dicoccoides]
MAGEAVNAVVLAVTSELTSRVFSGLIQRYGKDAATREKLQRLEMLLIKINSAVEASQKRTIKNSWLLQWRDKPALQGMEVLASFTQRVKDAEETSDTNNPNQQQGEAASSSASAPATDVGPLSFRKHSLSGMLQGIRNTRAILFSSGSGDTVRLNKTLGSLEMLSPDISEFISLLHLEALPKAAQTHYGGSLSTWKTRKRRSSTRHRNPSVEPSLFSLSTKSDKTEEMSPEEKYPQKCDNKHIFDNKYSQKRNNKHIFELACKKLALYQKEQEFVLLRHRLEAAFGEISKAVELADSRDFEDLEWLSYWAGILMEAKEQVREALGATVDAKDKQERCEQEDELSSFVHRLEGLVWDAEYFKKLVDLCPAF